MNVIRERSLKSTYLRNYVLSISLITMEYGLLKYQTLIEKLSEN